MFKLKEPEYVLHRKAHSETSDVLSRVKFHEAKCILNIVMRQLADSTKNSTVLEIGCGSGAASIHMAYYTFIKNMIGIDADKSAIHQAQSASRFLGIERLHFIVASANSLPLRNASVNFILCQEVLEHVKVPDALLQESKRTLKNQGELLLTTPVTSFAPLSSDWLEIRLHDSLIIDEFAMHLNRFKPHELAKLIHKTGLQIKQTKFTNQYIAPLMVFALTLSKRRNLRKLQNKAQNKCSCSASCCHSLPNAIFMAGQTIEYAILNHLPFGSNIIILARNVTP